ncbi:MAG: hypothetical protein JXA06_02330 [Bacteroidetes bacterium]|nr:hypothetical protein [Bacteroidota bacterium]
MTIDLESFKKSIITYKDRITPVKLFSIFKDKCKDIREFDELTHANICGFKYFEIDKLINNFEKVNNCDDIVNTLLCELYKQHEEIVEKELVQSFYTHLATINLNDRETWINECDELLQCLLEVVNFKNISIFLRNDSIFEGNMSLNGLNPQKKEIRVEDILSIQPDHLTKLDNFNPLHVNLLDIIGINNDNIWVFRSRHSNENSLLSSLIVGEANNLNINIKLMQKLCSELTMHADLISNYFLIIDQQQSFEHKVLRFSHTFRTPLLTLLYDLDDLNNTITDTNIKNMINKVRREIRFAEMELRMFLGIPKV